LIVNVSAGNRKRGQGGGNNCRTSAYHAKSRSPPHIAGRYREKALIPTNPQGNFERNEKRAVKEVNRSNPYTIYFFNWRRWRVKRADSRKISGELKKREKNRYPDSGS